MNNEQVVNRLVGIGALVIILSFILFLSNNTLLIVLGIGVYIVFAAIFAFISMKQEKNLKE